MKQFLMLLTVFCLMGWGSSAAAEESEEDIILKYRMAGIKDAKTVEEAFVFLEKPKFQTAYDDYVRDLDVIRKTGRAPDKACLWRNFYKILIIYGVLGFTLISRLYNENAYSYEKLFIVIGIFVVFSLRYKERKFSLDIVKALLGIFLLNIFWAAIYLWLADSDKYLQFIIL